MILAFFTFITGLGLGYWWGDRDGTKDAERRWTEAVGRAADERIRSVKP